MQTIPILASAEDLGYGPIGVLIGVIVVMSTLIIALTHWIPKRKRSGAEKDATYEAGMPVIGDARRRFNVKFYLVAMLFLLFDVELIFMYPWAVVFMDGRAKGIDPAMMDFLFFEMVIFFVILSIGFIYAWGRGVFRYD